MTKDSPLGAFDFSKMLRDLDVPGIDMQAMLDAQRKNVEALQRANRAAAENFQAIVKRQVEMMQEAMSEIAQSMREGAASGLPEGAKRQGELFNRAFEKALANVREIAEMAAKSNQELFDVVNQRMLETTDEIRGLREQAGKAGGKSGPKAGK